MQYIHQYHHVCQTEFEQEKGILLELILRWHYCIGSVIEDYQIGIEIKARKDATEGTARCPHSDVAPSTVATNVAPVRKDFIPPSSIGISQESTAARTAVSYTHLTLPTI